MHTFNFKELPDSRVSLKSVQDALNSYEMDGGARL